MRALLVACLIVTAVGAQEPAKAPPALDEASKTKLQLIDTQVENVQLKMALLQAEFARLQEAQARLVAGMAVDGYQLQRGPDGWAYVPLPPKK